MWEREYEQGRWNGVALNILATSLNGGKRLQVSEIPYAELPDIKVMGSSANNIEIDVVLVGSNSLVEANALLNNLNKTPKGELEHPWLGELPLVFETYGQKLSTKLGLVTLSLKFIRDGKPSAVTASTVVTSVQTQQADTVETVSTKTFVDDVDTMNIADTNSLQADFTHAITQLSGIANQLSVPSQTLSALNQEINSALVSISSIANAPAQFAEQLSKTIDSVADAVRSETDSDNEATDNSRAAQASMLEAINTQSPSTHYNVQLVVAAVKMSKDIERLEQEDTFDILSSKGQSSTILSDLQQITREIDARVYEVTTVSTLESLELFDALISLKEGVSSQSNKVKKGSEPQGFLERARFIPALVLAKKEKSSAPLVMALNPLQHPLFLSGVIAMRGNE